MRRSLIPYLLLLNAVALFPHCASSYRHLRRLPADTACVENFRPAYRRTLYKTAIEVVGKKLSGLLLIKKMPDSSTRIVFSSETGFSFFDFGFGADTGFTVYHIIPQMDKHAVLTTLRKDFELILFKNTEAGKAYTLRGDGLDYHAYPQAKGVNYYITDTACRRMLRMQRASARKPVMEAVLTGSPAEAPDSISIRHLNFNFTILLRKLNP